MLANLCNALQTGEMTYVQGIVKEGPREAKGRNVILPGFVRGMRKSGIEGIFVVFMKDAEGYDYDLLVET